MTEEESAALFEELVALAQSFGSINEDVLDHLADVASIMHGDPRNASDDTSAPNL